MGIKFNAGEVFDMAVKIEQNGAAFYRKAAELKGGGPETNFLLELAEMEDGHEVTFKKMAEELSGRETETTSYDPMDESALYLSAMADGHGGEGSPSVADSLTGDETMEDIVKIAMGLEGKSILFYIGIKDMVSEKAGKDRIDEIIQEEKSHVVILNGVLRDLKG